MEITLVSELQHRPNGIYGKNKDINIPYDHYWCCFKFGNSEIETIISGSLKGLWENNEGIKIKENELKNIATNYTKEKISTTKQIPSPFIIHEYDSDYRTLKTEYLKNQNDQA